MSVEEGLRLITHAVAFLNFEEDLKGTLEPGKLADFVVLSDDPREVPADEIQVEMTVVGGGDGVRALSVSGPGANDISQ